jgi:hypothetical protein
VRLLEVRLHRENLTERGKRFGMLEALGRTPQQERAREVGFRQRGIESQRLAAMML